jgi:hypothetical protein
MADVADLAAPVTAPIGWAKARPVAFFFFFLILVVVIIRFRDKIAALLAKIPVVGKWLTGITHTGAPAAALALLLGAGLVAPHVHLHPVRELTPHVVILERASHNLGPIFGPPTPRERERGCAHA